MNKQQKRKRDKRRELFASVIEAARQSFETCVDEEPGKASEFIHPLDDLRSGNKVWLCLRISGDEPKRNLRITKNWLRRHVREVGAVVVGITIHIGTGKDPAWIADAAAKAKRRGADYLLAYATDRFVRHPDFDNHHLDAQATKANLEDLQCYADELLYPRPDAGTVAEFVDDFTIGVPEPSALVLLISICVVVAGRIAR